MIMQSEPPEETAGRRRDVSMMTDGTPGEVREPAREAAAAVVALSLSLAAILLVSLALAGPAVADPANGTDQCSSDDHGDLVGISAAGFEDSPTCEPLPANLSNAGPNITGYEMYRYTGYESTNIAVLNRSLYEFGNHTARIALTEAQHEYVRALDQGASETEARERSLSTLSEHFSDREVEMLSRWNKTVSLYIDLRENSQTAGIAENRTRLMVNSGSYYTYKAQTFNSLPYSGTVRHTLPNGTDVPVKALHLGNITFLKDSGWSTSNETVATGSISHRPDSWTAGLSNGQVVGYVTSPTTISSATGSNSVDFREYRKMSERLREQHNRTQARLSEWFDSHDPQDTGDLSSPWLSRQFNVSEDPETWLAATLGARGVALPSRVEEISSMTVSNGDKTVSGLMLSEQGGLWVREGDTVDPTGFEGDLLVVSGREVHRFSEPVEVEAIGGPNATGYAAVDLRASYPERSSDLRLIAVSLGVRQSSVAAGGGGVGSGQTPAANRTGLAAGGVGPISTPQAVGGVAGVGGLGVIVLLTRSLL